MSSLADSSVCRMGTPPMRLTVTSRTLSRVDGSEELLVEVRRGPYVESVHHVSACVVRADGEVLRSFGDVDRPYPIRSLAKPFIAAELVRSGACEAFGLGDIEIALASGSHDGEPDHVAAVRRFLAKIGVTENELLCGPAMEGKITIGTAVRNNCSGKHAAVLAMCRHLSLTTDDYTAPDHPVQQHLLPRLLGEFGRSALDAPLAIDGCGMPIFGASLKQIAAAYAKFGVASDPAIVRVRNAIVTEPAYVGGWSGNIDTQVASWSQGSIVAKIGAEGLHGDAVGAMRIGISAKVRDGNSRALPAVLAPLFLSFDSDSIDRHHLDALGARIVLTATGRQSGTIRVAAGAKYVQRR